MPTLKLIPGSSDPAPGSRPDASIITATELVADIARYTAARITGDSAVHLRVAERIHQLGATVPHIPTAGLAAATSGRLKSLKSHPATSSRSDAELIHLALSRVLAIDAGLAVDHPILITGEGVTDL